MSRSSASLSSPKHSLLILFVATVEQDLNDFGENSWETLVEVVWQFKCKFLVIRSKNILLFWASSSAISEQFFWQIWSKFFGISEQVLRWFQGLFGNFWEQVLRRSWQFWSKLFGYFRASFGVISLAISELVWRFRSKFFGLVFQRQRCKAIVRGQNWKFFLTTTVLLS